VALALAGTAATAAAAWGAAVPTWKPPAHGAALEGYWAIDDASRRVDVRAELTPPAAAIAKRNGELAAERLAKGEPVGLGSYTCAVLGVPFIYGTSEPIEYTVTDDEVIQVAERTQMTPRHFYTDGRPWPDLSKMPPSTNGYSIGRWEGEDLVVETRGMQPGGITGGGMKSPATVLVERFAVTDGGRRLKLSFTWTDPTTMTKPLEYSFMYDREAPHTYAYGFFCDPHEKMEEVYAQ
jgi:hypothetical protein